MYKHSGGIRQNSSVWNTRVTTAKLQVRWCEMIYHHFQISSKISVTCVHISRSRYTGWETDISRLDIPFIQKEVKMKPFRCRVNEKTSYPGLNNLARLIDITWEKRFILRIHIIEKTLGTRLTNQKPISNPQNIIAIVL